jgi:hypothetical protein
MPHGVHCGSPSHPDTFRGSIVCKADRKKFSELRISQAYISLLCIAEGSDSERMISLARFGHYEVRMFDVAQADSTNPPLFWLELFDHEAHSAVDSCSCYTIEEASTVFDQLVSQAGSSNGESGDDAPSA